MSDILPPIYTKDDQAEFERRRQFSLYLERINREERYRSYIDSLIDFFINEIKRTNHVKDFQNKQKLLSQFREKKMIWIQGAKKAGICRDVRYLVWKELDKMQWEEQGCDKPPKIL